MHDELDLQIAHLLQLDPRIPWVTAAQILGMSASSLARRWARLTEAGLAWITTYPSPTGDCLTAFIDVQCTPGSAPGIATELCRHPTILSLDECSGGRDLLITVMVRSQGELSAFVLDTLHALPGVTNTRCSLVTNLHTEGSSWRLDALDPEQQRAVQAQMSCGQAGGHPAPPDSRLLRALAQDGRASVASLAREVGRPSSTVHRELGHLRGHRQVVSRCDVAPELSGWSIEWSWFANVPMGAKTAVIETLRHRPELRMCASTTGAANLVFSMRARHFDELAQFERMLAAAHPTLTPNETMVHLRARKRMGWLLTQEGRATEVVAPDFARILPECMPAETAERWTASR
ncbi:Lrp/AsnC family transcriptional regulator [Granulicoccus sp. GXG6511]|uniref:Lrp/AsnC family transcriptional regulator n=1 Tax=Granulicoccus sp. GXG6511 TaxID=3381351 RepID=UPI003D7CDDF8